jgi:hypothetical protein
MTTKSYTKTRFSADDAALVLIDHQSGICSSCMTIRRLSFATMCSRSRS